MTDAIISELEVVVQRLVQQNKQLKTELAALNEQVETLQLEVMEKDELHSKTSQRIQAMLQQLSADTAANAG